MGEPFLPSVGVGVVIPEGELVVTDRTFSEPLALVSTRSFPFTDIRGLLQ